MRLWLRTPWVTTSKFVVLGFSWQPSAFNAFLSTFADISLLLYADLFWLLVILCNLICFMPCLQIFSSNIKSVSSFSLRNHHFPPENLRFSDGFRRNRSLLICLNLQNLKTIPYISTLHKKWVMIMTVIVMIII